MKHYIGLWLNEKNGKKWFSGKFKDVSAIMEGQRFSVWKNDRKRNDRDPDYQIVWEDQNDAPRETARDRHERAENPSSDSLPF